MNLYNSPREVGEVRRPVVEAVEDVRGVKNRSPALLAFLAEPHQQVLPHNDICKRDKEKKSVQKKGRQEIGNRGVSS